MARGLPAVVGVLSLTFASASNVRQGACTAAVVSASQRLCASQPQPPLAIVLELDGAAAAATRGDCDGHAPGHCLRALLRLLGEAPSGELAATALNSIARLVEAGALSSGSLGSEASSGIVAAAAKRLLGPASDAERLGALGVLSACAWWASEAPTDAAGDDAAAASATLLEAVMRACADAHDAAAGLPAYVREETEGLMGRLGRQLLRVESPAAPAVPAVLAHAWLRPLLGLLRSRDRVGQPLVGLRCAHVHMQTHMDMRMR